MTSDTRKTLEEPILAEKGLIGWHVKGRHGSGTYSCGPYDELPADVPYAVDMSAVYESQGHGEAAIRLWKRPNLDLGLPDDNVRHLFEGCIGKPGTTEGHPWDGELNSLRATDGVGINVYLAVLEAAGGERVR